MLVYSPDSFLLKPGAVLLDRGLAARVLAEFRAGYGGWHRLNLYWMLFGVTCATLGYSSVQIGILARIMHGLRSGIDGNRSTPTYLQPRYDSWPPELGNRSAAVGMLAWHYVREGLRLSELSYPGDFRFADDHPGIPDFRLQRSC